MNPELLVLAGTAATIAFMHTLLGVDHYLPLSAVSSVRGWTYKKLIGITTLVGAGHIVGRFV